MAATKSELIAAVEGIKNVIKAQPAEGRLDPVFSQIRAYLEPVVDLYNEPLPEPEPVAEA